MSCNREHCQCCVHHHQGSPRGQDEQCVEWVMGLLKKSGRGGKTEFFTVLDRLLRWYRLTFTTSQPHLPTYASDTSLASLLTSHWCSFSRSSHISPHWTSLSSPRCSPCSLDLTPIMTFPALECELLSNIYLIAHSSLVSCTASMLFSCFSLHLFGLTYRSQFMSC